MRKKRKSVLLITQEQAIEKMTRIHNGFYSYEKTEYTGATRNMVVTCPLHGDFVVSYTNHTHKCRPRGCPTCGEISAASKRTLPVERFLKQAETVHGNKYNYSKIEYKNKEVKVEILCKLHGSFWQSPEKHLTGQGCSECSGHLRMTAERFKSVSDKTHGSKYSYELVLDSHFDSHNKSRKVPIICSQHGVFKQHFGNHTQGQGCPKCAKFGFKTSRPGNLYVLDGGDCVKVGITNYSDVNKRVKQISKSSGKIFEIVETRQFADGSDCLNTETIVLKHLRSLYQNPPEVFDGSTECFVGVEISEVQKVIDNLMEVV